MAKNIFMLLHRTIRGADTLELYPSENAISVNQTLKGGTILPKNVVEVIPNPPVLGYLAAKANSAVHDSGNGFGSVQDCCEKF